MRKCLCKFVHVTFSHHSGCYKEHHIQSSKFCKIVLRTSSPGLCQEKCLEKDISIFAVQVFIFKISMSTYNIAINIFLSSLTTFFLYQANMCICLSRHFDYSSNILPPSKCNIACNNSVLLLHECGGESAYSVFWTGS